MSAILIQGQHHYLCKVTQGYVSYPCSRAYPIFNVSYFNEALLNNILTSLGFQIVHVQKLDQLISKSKLSGIIERMGLDLLYKINRIMNSQYQIFMACKYLDSCNSTVEDV